MNGTVVDTEKVQKINFSIEGEHIETVEDFKKLELNVKDDALNINLVKIMKT